MSHGSSHRREPCTGQLLIESTLSLSIFCLHFRKWQSAYYICLLTSETNSADRNNRTLATWDQPTATIRPLLNTLSVIHKTQCPTKLILITEGKGFFTRNNPAQVQLLFRVNGSENIHLSSREPMLQPPKARFCRTENQVWTHIKKQLKPISR